MYEV
ncbi:hypothetical protein TF3313_0401 [Tannerella forsythia 3313]